MEVAKKSMAQTVQRTRVSGAASGFDEESGRPTVAALLSHCSLTLDPPFWEPTSARLLLDGFFSGVAGQQVAGPQHLGASLTRYFIFREKPFDAAGNLFAVRFEGEVAGIEQMRL